MPLLTESLTRFEALGDLRAIATVQVVRGATLVIQGDLEAGTESLAASLTGHAHLHDPWYVSLSLSHSRARPNAPGAAGTRPRGCSVRHRRSASG